MMRKGMYVCTAALLVCVFLFTACGAREIAAQTALETVPVSMAEDTSMQPEQSTQPEQTSVAPQNESGTQTAAATTQKETTAAPDTTVSAAVSTTAARTTAVSTTAAPTTAVSTAAAASAQDRFNAAPLNPMQTNDPQLDAQIAQLLGRIVTQDMQTYDKVRACYDYVITHAKYGTPTFMLDEQQMMHYRSMTDAWIVLFSKELLRTGVGVCNDYAALFLVLTRAIGLDCYYIGGNTTNTKGETKGHMWNVITVDGTDYLFDTQVEDKQSADGIRYTFFCKTFSEPIARIYSGYDLAQSKAAFGGFALNEVITVYEEQEFSGFAPEEEGTMYELGKR